MSLEFENELYKIYWYDNERTILMVEIFGRWTWNDAREIVDRGNDILAQVNHEKYLICHAINEATKLPIDNASAISTMQYLMKIDPSEEELCVFVGSLKMLRRLIRVTSEIYSLFGKTQKYHYTEDIETALAEINHHKSQNSLV